MDSSGLVCNNLIVGGGTSGTLVYGATAGALTVSGSVTVNTGASFNAGASALTTHTLAVGGTSTTVSAGSITNNGTFDMNTTASANVTFGGNINGTLSGSGTPFDFFSITLNKGTTSAPMLDVTSVITMFNDTNFDHSPCPHQRYFSFVERVEHHTDWRNSESLARQQGDLWLNNAGAIYNSGSAGSPDCDGRIEN